jgi:hypothetical protein
MMFSTQCPSLCRLLLVAILLTPHALVAQVPQRTAIPAEAAVAEAKKLIADVYKKDYENAKTPLERQALAKKLIEDAGKSQDDPAARFALLQVARKMSVAIGDVATAMQVVDETAAAFEVIPGDDKCEVFEELANQAKTAEDNSLLARYILLELEPLVAAENLATAQKLTQAGLLAAKKSKETDLIKQWTRRREQLETRIAASFAAETAKTTLATSPTDEQANRIAGEYACFWQRDWETGLPLLALGDDKPLAAVATQELRGVKSTAEQLALADAWYDASLNRSEPITRAMQAHAEHHYRMALPSLQALALVRVEKRLEELRQASSPFPINEWVEILDLVELPKHIVENQWQREGLSVVTRQTKHGKMFRIPVEIHGNFELKIEVTPLSSDGISISLSRTVNDVFFAHANWGGQITGLNYVNGQDAGRNASKTEHAKLTTGRKLQLIIQVETRGDQATISSMLDNRRLSRWSGPLASIGASSKKPLNSLYVRHVAAGLAIHSVQLKLKSGTAWITD